MDLTLLFTWIFRVIGIYLAVGLLIALWLITGRLAKVDPMAREGTLGFRLLIIPGMLVFWPLFLARLLRGTAEPPVENNPHRRAAHEHNGGDV